MKTRARVGKTELIFTSPFAKERFFEMNQGKHVYIVLDENPSSEMRRYFEGCLVPIMFYTHPNSGWKDFSEAREVLKHEFLAVKTIKDRKGFDIEIVPSTADLSKERFKNFLDAITNWYLENQLAVADDIDSENYKAWRDSAPAADSVYPPLKRLKERYDEARK